MTTREDYKRKIYDIIMGTSKNLKDLYNNGSSDLQIIFPNKSSHEPNNKEGDIRVSEQELRFAFVEKFLDTIKTEGWHYSVETPTKFYYRSARNGNEPSLNGTRSGKIDLTLYDERKNPIAFFEFKSGSLTSKIRELKYDILKLIMESLSCNNDNYLGYSLHLVKANKNTITEPDFNKYIDEAIAIIKNTTEENSKEYKEIEPIKTILTSEEKVNKLKSNLIYMPIAICESPSTAE